LAHAIATQTQRDTKAMARAKSPPHDSATLLIEKKTYL